MLQSLLVQPLLLQLRQKCKTNAASSEKRPPEGEAHFRMPKQVAGTSMMRTFGTVWMELESEECPAH